MKRLKFYGVAALTIATLVAIRCFQTSRSNSVPRTIATPTTKALASASRSAHHPSGRESTEASQYPTLRAFSDWTARYLRGDQSDLQTGERLAMDRRNVMLHLIKTDPEKALSLAVSEQVRRELPESITKHFEKRIDGRGSLTVMVATDFEHNKRTTLREVEVGQKRYAAFVYGWRANQMTRESIPVHGIAIDGKLALSSDPLRRLDSEEIKAAKVTGAIATEAICGVSGKLSTSRNEEIVADAGGEILSFCSREHFDLARKQWIAAEGGATVSGGFVLLPGSWTQGPKTALYMRVNFLDDLTEPISETAAYATMSSVNSFYVENSYNTTALIPTVTPVLTLPQTKNYYGTEGAGALMSDARQAAKDAGYDTANFDRDIVAFPGIAAFDWGGLGSVGGKGVWLQSKGVGVTCHELGHNEGLWHANSWGTPDDSIVGAGEHDEYGNVYDTMGQASAGANHFNAMHKSLLDWLPKKYRYDVTTNGVYRIYPFDVPTRVNGHMYAVKIKRDWQRDYWLETRQRFPSNDWVSHGVLVNWDPWLNSSGGTHLLDMTPGTPTSQEGKEDAALVIGRTFSDAAAGVHITPIAQGPSTNNWMDILVNLGSFVGNRPPTVQVTADQTNAAPGTRINFRAVATDADGDTLSYHWQFEDLTFSTNNSSMAYNTWATAGDHVARCIVSDMKGGVASGYVVVKVGSATTFRISGKVTDSNGSPLEGVRVDNGATDINTYIGGYTDSKGLYTIVGVSNQTSLTAVKYGYTFAATQVPASVPPDATGIDFVGAPQPQVSLSVSSTNVSEAGGTVSFTITRSGDTSLDLPVTLYTSGSAIEPTDYTLTPTQSGTNYVVTIPAGAASFSIDLQTVNDANTEGPETVTLTLAEDTNYVVRASGEATVTIDDDDAAQLPTVSVSATTSSGDNSAPENGADSGRFVFTRNGTVANDLTVFYSVAGGATPSVDYSALPGVIVIPAGQSSASVEFQTIDDTLVETNETVLVSVSSNAAYTTGGSTAKVTIVDDDLVNVTITATGGAAEPSTAGKFTITRTGDLSPALTVYYSVSGTATAGTDFAALTGTATIPAGATTTTITVTPINDTATEGDESVTVTLLGNSSYNVGSPGVATLFIVDDEQGTVSVTAPDNSASEPGSDTGYFRVSRGTIINGDLTVNLLISGTAQNGIDYIPLDNTVVIPDGQSSVDIVVTPFDDLHKEDTENVILIVAPGGGYAVSTSNNRASLNIVDDDANSVPAIGFSFPTSRGLESRSADVALSLSATSTVPITVDFRVFGGTASGNGVDYTLPSGTVTVNPGDWTATLPLTIINDSIVESDETVKIVISNPSGATLDGNKFHTYTIVDDDVATVTISNTVATAFESGPVPGGFRISRTGSTTNNLTVGFEVTGSASEPSDYQSIGSSVTIPAGSNYVDIPVLPVNDGVVEVAETVVATLTSATGAKLGSAKEATVTILDDDVDGLPVVGVSATDPIAIEPNDPGSFTFSRTGSTAASLELLFTVSGSASSGVDYVSITNRITIPAGQTSAVVNVTPIDDLTVEGEETVFVTLSVSNTYRVSSSSVAWVKIQDNEQNVRLNVSYGRASEPGTNAQDVGEFTFTRFGTTNSDLTVFFTVTGTASNGLDYVFITNSIVIHSNDTMALLPITPIDDVLRESAETVTINLATNAAYFLTSQTNGTVTIYDNEPTLTLVGTSTNASENGQSPGVFTIYRDGDPNVQIRALVQIGGTATFGIDYPIFATNICMPAGVMSAEITFYPTNELLLEEEETVTALLLPSPDYTILSPSNAVATIADAGTNHFPIATITSPIANVVFINGTNANLILEANATDEGMPGTNLTYSWMQVSGPTNMTFGDTTTNNTTVSFFDVGIYVLRFIADDGQLKGTADLTVLVGVTNVYSSGLFHWKFDEGSGTNALDSTTNGLNGVVVGASWTSNAVTGAALDFNGASNVVQQLSSTNVLNGLSGLTVSFWAKTTATNQTVGVFSGDAANGTNATLSFYQGPFTFCDGISNVLQATLSTSDGDLHYVSSRSFASNQWQHVTMCWSTGQQMAVYIDGVLDHPAFNTAATTGTITNCSQFVVGRSSLTNFWLGSLDEVQLLPRSLTSVDVGAAIQLPPTNFAPVVNAGTNFTIQLTATANLTGTVTDDGMPNPPGLVTNWWTFVSGPGTPVLTNSTNATAFATFTNSGAFVFRLIADDGSAKVYSEVTVTVLEPTLLSIQTIDGEAAELGPDLGQFTITRVGDTNYDLEVPIQFSGFASNGVDFVAVTNLLVIPAGSNTVDIVITPFLDNRTEGDETVTITIITNLAYTISSASAAVTIHDSPYGVWTINHFTLEELTDPSLSGETADLDQDNFGNFIEYAFNRDPRTAETNASIVSTIEMNTADSKNHINLVYQRRIQRVDVRYGLYISTDLNTWNTGTNYVEEILVTNDGNGVTETVKARVVAPFDLRTNQFINLRVWRPAQP